MGDIGKYYVCCCWNNHFGRTCSDYPVARMKRHSIQHVRARSGIRRKGFANSSLIIRQYTKSIAWMQQSRSSCNIVLSDYSISPLQSNPSSVTRLTAHLRKMPTSSTPDTKQKLTCNHRMSTFSWMFIPLCPGLCCSPDFDFLPCTPLLPACGGFAFKCNGSRGEFTSELRPSSHTFSIFSRDL